MHQVYSFYPSPQPTLSSLVQWNRLRSSCPTWWLKCGERPCGERLPSPSDGRQCQRRNALKALVISGCSQNLKTSTPSNGAMAPRCAENLHWHGGCVEREKREKLLNQKGCIVWITGLSGSGKSTLSCALDHTLAAMGKLSYVLDGDNIRHGLSQNLGFSAEDREENIRRVGEVAKLFTDAGVITLVSFISPYQRDRDFVRSIVPPGEFIEVFMKVPLEVCESRDCKGLYKLARSGVLKGFTGVDDPYEIPENPEIVLEATNAAGEFFPAEHLACTLVNYLKEKGFLECPSS